MPPELIRRSSKMQCERRVQGATHDTQSSAASAGVGGGRMMLVRKRRNIGARSIRASLPSQQRPARVVPRDSMATTHVLSTLYLQRFMPPISTAASQSRAQHLRAGSLPPTPLRRRKLTPSPLLLLTSVDTSVYIFLRFGAVFPQPSARYTFFDFLVRRGTRCPRPAVCEVSFP